MCLRYVDRCILPRTNPRQTIRAIDSSASTRLAPAKLNVLVDVVLAPLDLPVEVLEEIQPLERVGGE